MAGCCFGALLFATDMLAVQLSHLRGRTSSTWNIMTMPVEMMGEHLGIAAAPGENSTRRLQITAAAVLAGRASHWLVC